MRFDSFHIHCSICRAFLGEGCEGCAGVYFKGLALVRNSEVSAGQESTVHYSVRALYSRKFALYYGLLKSLPLHYLLVNLFTSPVHPSQRKIQDPLLLYEKRQPLAHVHVASLFRYREGMLKTQGGNDLETEQVVQSVAEGMLTITDMRGQDAVEDWEVDELLEWTNGLNFDQ